MVIDQQDVNETFGYETETFGFQSEVRPRRDLPKILRDRDVRFSVRDETETETLLAETETFFETFCLVKIYTYQLPYHVRTTKL